MSIGRCARIALMSLTLVALGATLAQGTPRIARRPVRSVMICYFTNATDYSSRSVGAAFGRMLRYRASNLPQLSNLPPLNVVERVMSEEKLSGRLTLSLPDALRVAKASGQEWVAVGSVSRTNSKYTVRAEIYGSASGRRIGKSISVAGQENDLPGLEARLATAVFSSIGLQFTSPQRADLSKPLTRSYKAVRSLGDYLLSPERGRTRLLNTLVAADRNFPLAAVQKIDWLLDRGRSWEALNMARQWSTKLPNNRDFRSYQFGALIAIHRLTEANAVLKSIEADYPDSFSATLLRYWLQRFQGDVPGALASAQRLTALNRGSSEGYARLAIASLERGLQLSQDKLPSQMSPVQSRQFTTDIQAACRAGEQAVRIDSKFEDAWLVLMAAYRERGDFSKSQGAFKQVMALNAANCDALSSQGVNHFCRKDIKSARKMWENCLSRDPRRGEALLGLALCDRSLGNARAATQKMRRALTYDKQCNETAYLRVRRYWPVQLTQAVASLGARR